MKKLILPTLITIFTLISGVAAAVEGERAEVTDEEQLFICARTTFQASQPGTITRDEIQTLIDLFNEMREEGPSQDLVSRCYPLMAKQLMNHPHGVFDETEVFSEIGKEYDEDQPILSFWMDQINEMSEYSKGSWILRHIIDPKEKCEEIDSSSLSIFVVGGAWNTFRCVNTGGYSYEKFRTVVGAAMYGGCSVLGIGKEWISYRKMLNDNWEYSINYMK